MSDVCPAEQRQLYLYKYTPFMNEFQNGVAVFHKINDLL